MIYLHRCWLGRGWVWGEPRKERDVSATTEEYQEPGTDQVSLKSYLRAKESAFTVKRRLTSAG